MHCCFWKKLQSQTRKFGQLYKSTIFPSLGTFTIWSYNLRPWTECFGCVCQCVLMKNSKKNFENSVPYKSISGHTMNEGYASDLAQKNTDDHCQDCTVQYPSEHLNTPSSSSEERVPPSSYVNLPSACAQLQWGRGTEEANAISSTPSVLLIPSQYVTIG